MLGQYWWFKKYKQAELEDPSEEKFLGITVGRDWEIPLEDEVIFPGPSDLFSVDPSKST